MFVELHRKDNGNQITINPDYVVYFIQRYVKEQSKEGVRYTPIGNDPLTIRVDRTYNEEKFIPDGTEIYINGCTTMLVVSETYEEVSKLLN